ncbi:hypothetical protein N8H71_25495 [Pseudomonas koreensis]|uniref:hypothetical protein n=1 Tax=Pseudomonas koreensis TaxID=198620 RepID=UPI0021C69AE4|nr:hypothetical protein [Pseudomonas koreensis]MCU0074963.1 hypothetical protein [Pseudomonas koreensis]
MNTKITISAIVNSAKQYIDLVCNDDEISITLKLPNDKEKTYKSTDFYKCFGQLREDNSNIQFLCKGSQINVHPSSMSSQMSLGLKAYELTIGKAPSLDDVVFIFDYEDKNLTNNPKDQRDFYFNWITVKP